MSLMELPLLIEPGLLHQYLDDQSLVVIDATVRLEPTPSGRYERVSGRTGFDQAHIPGAVFADLIGEFSDPDAAWWFTLPSPRRFAAAAGALGVSDGAHVVVYTQVMPQFATRLWWLFRYFGFDSVSVLNGGLRAWGAAGYPVTAGPSVPATRQFTPRPRAEMLARREDVEVVVAAPDPGRLLNALSVEDFRGETNAYGRPGRIPGSVSMPWSTLLEPDTDRLLPPDRLRDRLATSGIGDDRPVISYCGGGIAASLDVFALAVLGRTEGVRLYDGSLTEWAADPTLPLLTG